jgi:hypothetical protein
VRSSVVCTPTKWYQDDKIKKGWTGHATFTGETINIQRVLVGKYKGKDTALQTQPNREIILKWNLQKKWKDVKWIQLAQIGMSGRYL